MKNNLSLPEIYEFLIDNGLVSPTYSEQIFATSKGRRLLDYLGLLYDYDSIQRYKHVFRSVPSEHKNAVKLVTDKENIGHTVSRFQYIYTIIIPKNYNDNSPIPQKLFKIMRQEFIDHFGGATRVKACGDFLSPYGLQHDRCELFQGFGLEGNRESDMLFIRDFAIKIGSKNFCNQDAVTITEEKRNIEIIDTLDLSEEISYLSKFELFSLRTMLILAAIAGTDYNEQNRHIVAGLGRDLGFDEW